MRGFLAWALAGLLIALSLAGAASIGIFVLPFALLALVLAARWAPDSAFGLLSGFGVLALGIAVLHLGAHLHCPTSGTAGPGQPGSSCEEFDIRPWLAAGVVLTAAGLAVLAARTRPAGPRGAR